MLKLGCIADDALSARDLSCNLVSAGMRVIQTQGVPRSVLDAPVDAVVMSLDTHQRSRGQAVVRALDALVWLKAQGATQYYYCCAPTLNSGSRGDNKGHTGAVVQALMKALGMDFTVVVPAFPDHGYTLFKGYLFNGQQLLHERMRDKERRATRTDANLQRLLQAQVRSTVDLIDHDQVGDTSAAVQERMATLRLKHHELALVDATTNADLERIALAVKHMVMVAGSAGLGSALPKNHDIRPTIKASRLPPPSGARAVLCGSGDAVCARQIQQFAAAGRPIMAIDPLKVAKFGVDKVAQAALAWAKPLLNAGPVLLHSTADAQSVQAVQALLGVKDASNLVEHCMAAIAGALLTLNVRQLLLAGSSTGRSCLRGLGLSQFLVGPQVDPGIAWCFSRINGDAMNGLHVLVKPGAVGSDDFFLRAFDSMR